jgi:hypothetical protein
MTITQRPRTPMPEVQQPQGLSPKARTWIAVGALAFCLIVGAGIVWFFLLGSSPKRRTVTVDPAQQTPTMPGGGGVRFAPQRPRDMRGVNKINNSEWLVRGDAGTVRINKTSDGTYKLAFAFPKGLNLASEQIKLMAGRYRILADPAMAKDWKVTDDQVEKLKKIEIGGALQPSATDQSTIRQLWDGYTRASDGPSKMDAQKKLTEKLDAIAKANLDSARTLYSQKIEQIKQVLTSEQVQKITQ